MACALGNVHALDTSEWESVKEVTNLTLAHPLPALHPREIKPHPSPLLWEHLDQWTAFITWRQMDGYYQSSSSNDRDVGSTAQGVHVEAG
jgi:hypothetical protein